jgi:chemotaxis protein MotB
MKKTLFLLFISTQFYCVSSAKYESLAQESAQTKSQLAEVSTSLETKAREYSDLETRLKTAESERDTVKKELATIKAASEKQTVTQRDLAVKLDSTSKSEADLKARAATLEQNVQKLQTEKQSQEKTIADLQKQVADLKTQIAGVKPSKTIDEAYADLVKSLRGEVERGDIKIEQVNNQLRLSVAERVFFLSGSAQVSAPGKEVLRKLAGSLQSLKNKDIFVEGHTDSVSIGSALLHRFPTNWELGSARAVNVVRFLSEQNGLEASRLSAVSHGSNRPVADNSTEEGRAKNRRIEITILESTPFNSSLPAGKEEIKVQR